MVESAWDIRGATLHQNVVVTGVGDIWRAHGTRAYNGANDVFPVIYAELAAFWSPFQQKKQCVRNFRLHVKECWWHMSPQSHTKLCLCETCSYFVTSIHARSRSSWAAVEHLGIFRKRQRWTNKKLSYGRKIARSLIRFLLTSSVILKIMHKIKIEN